MKYYNRVVLTRQAPMLSTFAVESDGRIITNSNNSFEVPSGTHTQRPTSPISGQIRFNTELGTAGEMEAYINGSWQIIRTNRQQTITQQEFDNGDYADTLFGPLSYNISTSSPQSVIVYVENVPQIPNTNYVLTSSTIANPIKAVATLTSIASTGTSTLFVTTVADFNLGQLITGTNISTNTTVIATSATDLTIKISTGTTGLITSGTAVVTTFGTGTYIKFVGTSLPVPNKPVVTLLGFDGYGPPFEL